MKCKILSLRHLLDITALGFALPLVVLSLIGAIILLVLIPSYYKYFSSPEFGTIYISSFIAIANALLLYVTLNSQKKGIEDEKIAHLQERFETTFFNLLESQRKLTEEISIKNEYIDDDGKIAIQKINGRHFFSFANNELQMISKTLESDIIKKFDEDDTSQSIQAFENKYNNTFEEITNESQKQREWKEFLYRTQFEFYNLIYGISEDDKKRFLSDNNLHYSLFRKKWYVFFEHYIRNLYYILKYVNDEIYLDKESKKKYINFVQSQMSKEELKIIEIHAQSFPLYSKMLINTHLYMVIQKCTTW